MSSNTCSSVSIWQCSCHSCLVTLLCDMSTSPSQCQEAFPSICLVLQSFTLPSFSILLSQQNLTLCKGSNITSRRSIFCKHGSVVFDWLSIFNLCHCTIHIKVLTFLGPSPRRHSSSSSSRTSAWRIYNRLARMLHFCSRRNFFSACLLLSSDNIYFLFFLIHWNSSPLSL